MSKKVGLAVIYDPHNIYQFLWYYCTYGKDMDWYALCLPNSSKGEYLSEVCEKLGIFKRIFRDTKPFDSMPMKRRFELFIKMFLFAIFGQRKRFCENFIASYIDGLFFDTAVVLTDVGFISGMFLSLGTKKEIVILEDGMGDYIDRKYSNIFSHFHNFFDVQGFILSILGYSNTGHYFPLRTTKNCRKFSSHPDKMKYKKYKEMSVLFDNSNTDTDLLKRYSELLYPKLADYFSRDWDIVLLTTPITDYVSDDSKYIEKIQNYVKNNFKSVLIKKHPRDSATYNFGNDVVVKEIDQKIPAEVLLPYFNKTEIYFCEHSSTNLYMTAYNYKPHYFYFSELLEENLREREILAQYKAKEKFVNDLRFFGLPENVIEL